MKIILLFLLGIILFDVQDIEDLVSLGRRIRVCPYYASRDMSEQAQIVFSPYNYLIDPRVRQSMKIPINDNIIILDEAHNIEDSGIKH